MKKSGSFRSATILTVLSIYEVKHADDHDHVQGKLWGIVFVSPHPWSGWSFFGKEGTNNVNNSGKSRQSWGVAKGSSISWGAKCKGDKIQNVSFQTGGRKVTGG